MDSNERSLAAVVRDIVQNIQDIVRAELRLAKKEISTEAGKAKTAAAFWGIGVVCALFGVLFALVAAVLALSRIIPDWEAALIVSVPASLVALGLISSERKHLAGVSTPPRTVETLKENVQCIKQHTK